MARFPKDQFDDIPADLARVGAHRAPPRRGRGWIALGWGVLAAAVLTIAGLYTLSRIDPEFTLALPDFSDPAPGPTISPLPTAEPVTDPDSVDDDLDLSISVLGATPDSETEDIVGDLIDDAGWPNPVRAPAATDDVEETVVYYRSADYEGVARGLVELLGVGRAVLSDFYRGAPVTIVVGADFDASTAG